AWLLRRFGSEIGLDPNFTIYDDEDSLSLLASCYPDRKKVELRPVMQSISNAKDRGMKPDDREAPFKYNLIFKQMYETYENRLRAVGNVDFADLICRSIELLQVSKSARSYCHKRFRMILVDEYQDTNATQFALLQRLVGPDTFICVVGDDDQSIYRFRGAEVANILSFPKHFANTRTIKLEQNYRSTAPILALANAIISTNKSRHEKELWTDLGGTTMPSLYYVQDDRDEVERVAQILNTDRRYNQSAILYRTNAQSRLFETIFGNRGIPHKVVGALPFYSREEVKDGLALLALLVNPRDEVSFRRIINKPARGIGPAALEKILALRVAGEGNFITMLDLAVQRRLFGPKTTEEIARIVDAFVEAKRLLELGNLVEMTTHLLTKSHLLAHYQIEDAKHRTFRVQNLDELVNAIGEVEQSTDGFFLFLEQLALDRTVIGDHDPHKEEGVTLITIHNTKGLEFDRVFVTGIEESLFPGRNGENIEDVEEERRLFYVAVTRARNELYLLSAKQRRLHGYTSSQKPSRFLGEIDPSLLSIVGSPIEIEAESESFFGDSTVGERPKDPQWALGGKNLIQQGFGKDAKTFVMKREHTPTSEDGPIFPIGQRVFCQNYGEGEVISSKTKRDGNEVIMVQFFSGKKATYIDKYADIEKVDPS
ncbi:MAG TPA: 3'-5' exonuclease, partial [Sphaerochaeta sp.]|nr:3'-5' exonuclease [Sphaerochaeta sp.]